MIPQDYSGLVIGFCKSYFTLWDCHLIHDKTLGPSQELKYLQTISREESVARAKYPDIPIDVTLNGTYKIIPKSGNKYPPDAFQFGKYQGQKISKCSDFEYLIWLYSSLNNYQQNLVYNILKDKGYKLYDGRIVTQEEYNILIEQDEELLKYALHLEQGKPITLECSRNLSVSGTIDWYDHIIKFLQYQNLTFKNHNYAVPISRGMKIHLKGKVLIIEDYTIERIRENERKYYIIPRVWSVE